MINIIHLVVTVTLPAIISASCAGNEFECYDGICIPDTQLCDSSFDCTSNEDENTTNCQAKCPGTCTEGQYQCTDCSCVTSQTDCPSMVTTEAQSQEPADKKSVPYALYIAIPLGVAVISLVVFIVWLKHRNPNRKISELKIDREKLKQEIGEKIPAKIDLGTNDSLTAPRRQTLPPLGQ